MPVIESLKFRRILNSHAEFTTEFVVRLRNGAEGIGASPQGETVSIYEERQVRVTPELIVQTLQADQITDHELTQETLDSRLDERVAMFGRNNAYSVSLAFFNATIAAGLSAPWAKSERPRCAPSLCCNILNGGRHAYTNPVLSDFPEYLLVARSTDVHEVIEQHHAIQRCVREKLLKLERAVVGGNPVFHFRAADNRECLDMLVEVRDSLGLTDKFDLMIDASAGDLWSDGMYRLAITDNSVRTREEFGAYWAGLIRQYPLRFLEDPFAEGDVESWRELTGSQNACWIIGDNYYSSDAARIEKGASGRDTHGVIIKPNQAGTVTGIRRAVETAQRGQLIAIASHRSVSTEETFLSTLTCAYGLKYIKIGPLFTDYSSVIRLNAILRLTS